MGIKGLGYLEIKKRANKFIEILTKKYSSSDQFGISTDSKIFLKSNSLAPIIATICDQQIKAENAWNFPHWLNVQIGDSIFSAQAISNQGKAQVKTWLQKFMCGKWPSGMRNGDQKKYLENTSNRIFETCQLITQ